MQANLSSVRARRTLIARQLTELQAEDTELASVEGVLLRLSVGAKSLAGPSVKRRGRKAGAGAVARKTNGAAKAKANGAAKSNGAAKANGAGKASGAGKTAKKARGRRGEAGSQRELVLAALKKPGAGWMDVRQIIASVKDTHGVNIPPRSLSPLLSNLKKAGALVRQGRRVSIPAARAR
jgi:hypothetical protein